MEMEIIPFERIGDLIFGMKREKVRELLGPDFREFRKGPNAKNTTDAYDDLDVHIVYNEENELDAVEIGPYEVKLIFNGIGLFEKEYSELIDLFKQYDDEPDVWDWATCAFYKIGFGFYRNNNENRVDLISVYSKEYTEILRNT